MLSRDAAWWWLLRKELRELAASRAYWLLLLVVGLLVGHAFITASDLYAEASGIGGGPAALSQGLTPLEGIVVPTLGAYDLAATLLLPFVVIRLFAAEKQTGALTLLLQAPGSFSGAIAAKGIALLLGWIVTGVPGALALGIWATIGGHLHTPETLDVVLGYLLRGLLTIGIGATASAMATSAASAAIVALSITIGTWAIDYVAAARSGTLATIAQYTPSAALRVFEHGELRASTVAVLLVLSGAGLAVAAILLREGTPLRRRLTSLGVMLVVTLALCFAAGRWRASVDVSENRRNSFSRADEAALRQIHAPLDVTVYLAAEDPRLADLERGVLAKLARVLPSVRVTYGARGRSGLFERPQDHYGEVWYELEGRRGMSRSTSDDVVLETIYQLAGREAPTPVEESQYPGYPLARRATHAALVFFVLWPLAVVLALWMVRRTPRDLQRASARDSRGEARAS